MKEKMKEGEKIGGGCIFHFRLQPQAQLGQMKSRELVPKYNPPDEEEFLTRLLLACV